MAAAGTGVPVHQHFRVQVRGRSQGGIQGHGTGQCKGISRPDGKGLLHLFPDPRFQGKGQEDQDHRPEKKKEESQEAGQEADAHDHEDRLETDPLLPTEAAESEHRYGRCDPQRPPDPGLCHHPPGKGAADGKLREQDRVPGPPGKHDGKDDLPDDDDLF